LAASPSDIVEHAVKRFVALGQFLIPSDRDAMGRERQKELKRVSCYAGELNVTTSARHAMSEFVARVKREATGRSTQHLAGTLSHRGLRHPMPVRPKLQPLRKSAPPTLKLARPNGTKLTALANG
jgi:hypothetical protein